MIRVIDESRAADGSLILTLAPELDLTAVRFAAPAVFPFLLQTARSPLADPGHDLLLGLPGQRLQCDANGRLDLDGDAMPVERKFLAELDDWFARDAEPAANSEWPFLGGWFVFLGYEMAAEIEPSLRLPATPWCEPQALAARCHGAIMRRHRDGQIVAIAEPGHEQAMRDALASVELAQPPSPQAVRFRSMQEEPAQRYCESVERIRDYIAAGDVFQVNISRRWQLELEVDCSAESVYSALCAANPAPFAAFCDLGEHRVISSSPERLVRRLGQRVDTRPIAGTRPRGTDDDSDAVLGEELMAHPKERAEHVMLIDLERNDLGRICRPGSIHVDEFMVRESYAHVHHIVSNVCGELREGIQPGDILAGVFPGGTITGCPKVRCMEIIAELEGEGRGTYTGSLGYLSRNGDLDMNILIRTMVEHQGRLAFRTGGGIVADSQPLPELEETRAKARGLLRALGLS